MATMGSIPGAWSGWESYQSSNLQVGIDAVVPDGQDQLVGLHAYIAREGGPGGLTLACWRGDTIIAALDATADASAGGIGGQSWCGGSFGAVAITPGETLTIGWQRGADASWDWSWGSGGNHYEQDSIGDWTGQTGTGLIGAYADVQQSVVVAPHPSLAINGAFELADGRLRINETAARLFINGAIAQR